MLNLFLALMLNSFATDSLNKKEEEKDNNKMKAGWKKLKGLFKVILSNLQYPIMAIITMFILYLMVVIACLCLNWGL